MEKPANYFKILQKLKNIGLRRQLQAQLQPIPNLPNYKDLIEISLCLFPDAVRSKQNARNVASVLQQLYRLDRSTIIQAITAMQPDIADFFASFTSDQENDDEATPRIRSPTPRQNKTPRVGGKTPRMPVAEAKPQAPHTTKSDPFYTLFDEHGTGLRQPGAGVQFIDPELQHVLSAMNAPELQSQLHYHVLEQLSDCLVSAQTIEAGTVFFVLDGVLTTVSALYQAVYYLYNQQANIEFLLGFLQKIFHVQTHSQALLFDTNAAELARLITFSENYNSELVFVRQLGQCVLSLRARQDIKQGEIISISTAHKWMKPASPLNNSAEEIIGYRAQFLRQDLKCDDALVQVQVQSVSMTHYHYFTLSAENSSLRFLFMKLCELMKIQWETVKDLPAEELALFQQMREMRNLYNGRLEEQAQIRLCDILGYW